MRKNICATMIAFGVVSTGFSADGPKKKSPPAGPDPRLEVVLAAWENASRDRGDVQCEFQLTRTGPLQKTAKAPEFGTLTAFRSDGTRIDLRDETGKSVGTYVWLDGQLRHFDFKTKLENVFTPGKPVGKAKLNPLAGMADKLAERMVGLPERFRFGLFGLTAMEAKNRFKVRLLREDQERATLALEPLLDADRQDVKSIEVTLDNTDFHLIRADIQSVIGVKFTIVPTGFMANQRPGSQPIVLGENLPTGWKKHYPLGGKASAQTAN